MWSAALCSSEEAASEDCDFAYVWEILRACTYLPEDSDIFLLLEKQQCLKGKDTSGDPEPEPAIAAVEGGVVRRTEAADLVGVSEDPREGGIVGVGGLV